MGMNIKSDEAHRLARELARLTGESVTGAVTEALRERLARLRRKGMAERVMDIARESAPLFKTPFESGDADAALYDERGLPR
jgi:antitoxin VapB